MVDKNLNLSTIDRVYIATNVNFNNNSNSDRDLNRYEFMEILVRLAAAKYKDMGVCQTYSEALIKLLHENIFPYIEPLLCRPFREKKLYTFKVNNLF